MELGTILILITAGLMTVTFAVQYLLLEKCPSRLLRAMPWTTVLALAVLAACSVIFRWGGGGWLDLSALLAFILGVWAACCAVSIGLAHLVHFLVKRNGE